MSRCFPYPPPGYKLSSAKYEALIESIKLQKEKERRKEKKEERKEKKEKGKETKENRKDETNPNLDKSSIPKHHISNKSDIPKHHISNKSDIPKHHISNKSDIPKHHISNKSDIPKHHISNKSDIPKHHISNKSDIPKHHISDKSDIPRHRITQNSLTDTNVKFLHKKREAETEQLEKSSLTEEHACPASLPVPSSSSESTEKSKKRKRNSSPEDDTHVHGKVVLIRLPSNKQNELDTLSKEQQQPCTASERSDLSDGSRDVDFGRDRPAKFLNRTSNIASHNTEQICSTSGQIETGKSRINNKHLFPKKAVATPMQKLELQYTNLLEDCFPPPIQDGCVFPTEDLDWLLMGRNQETRGEKKSKFGNESLSCSRRSGLWPRAEYLPEVDIYSLPYTVPY